MSAKFDSIWPCGFRGEDLNIKISWTADNIFDQVSYSCIRSPTKCSVKIGTGYTKYGTQKVK